MKKTPASSDLVESSFGVVGDIISNNDNLSLHSGTTLATWRTNHTASWIQYMDTLCPRFVHMMVKMSIPAGKVLKKESDARQNKAMRDQLQRMEESAAKTEHAEQRKIHQLLDLEDQEVVTTIEQLTKFTFRWSNCGQLYAANITASAYVGSLFTVMVVGEVR